MIAISWRQQQTSIHLEYIAYKYMLLCACCCWLPSNHFWARKPSIMRNEGKWTVSNQNRETWFHIVSWVHDASICVWRCQERYHAWCQHALSPGCEHFSVWDPSILSFPRVSLPKLFRHVSLTRLLAPCLSILVSPVLRRSRNFSARRVHSRISRKVIIGKHKHFLSAPVLDDYTLRSWFEWGPKLYTPRSMRAQYINNCWAKIILRTEMLTRCFTLSFALSERHMFEPIFMPSMDIALFNPIARWSLSRVRKNIAHDFLNKVSISSQTSFLFTW
jgi:hypothetical protein